MEFIKPYIYYETWHNCFYYYDKATNKEVRANNRLFSPIKFRII